MFRYTIDKPEHGSEEWLRVRWADAEGRKRISASVAGAIYNEHPYTSSADLAQELLSQTPPVPQPSTRDMERGNRMEPMLIKWAAESEGIDLVTPEQMYCYEDGTCRMIATLDAIDKDGTPYEVKTSRKRWDGELPRHWYWQGIHQAICAGADRIEWIIFDSSLDMYRHTQYVSSDETNAHIVEVSKFLASIDNLDIPENVIMSLTNVQDMYKKSEPITVEINADDYALVSALADVKAQISALEKQEGELQAKIGMVLQNAEKALYDGTEVVTWKTVQRDTLDTKALGEAHPALVSKFRKITEYRQMKIKRR